MRIAQPTHGRAQLSSRCFSVLCGFGGIVALVAGRRLEAVILLGGIGLYEVLARRRTWFSDEPRG